MLSPKAKTFLKSLVFVFLLVFLISLLLGFSLDTITFGDPICRLFLELFFGNLSRELVFEICTALLKTSSETRLLGEFNSGFPYDDSRIRAMIECEH